MAEETVVSMALGIRYKQSLRDVSRENLFVSAQFCSFSSGYQLLSAAREEEVFTSAHPKLPLQWGKEGDKFPLGLTRSLLTRL